MKRTPIPVRFRLRGMSCASCAHRLQNAIARLQGVDSVSVNFAASTADVAFHGEPDPSGVVSAVVSLGYEADLELDVGGSADLALQADEADRLRRSAFLGAALAAPIVTLEMGTHFVPAFHHWIDALMPDSLRHLFLLLLASVVQFGPGLRFYRQASHALRRGSPDMSTLVMIGTTAAWLYSALAVLAPGLLPQGSAHLYFEASASIITLVLIGRWLEVRTRGKTSQAIQRLASLRSSVARVKRETAIFEIPVGEVLPGDQVVLRPGERVPVDGEVISGETYVDQSMLTGEPLPIRRGPGDPLVGGTINVNGSVLYRATSLGAESVLARIIEMVRNAQGSKLPIQSLVDRVTAVFVPVVLLLATLTFSAWVFFGPDPALPLALVNAVAVLIIACPCAMGLATPTSIMVGTGRGAEMGILFRRGDALQSLANCSVIAFDKTGTLTMGSPTVSRIVVTEGVAESEALRLAASVEQHSEHPIGRSILQAAIDRGVDSDLEVLDFSAIAGLGVSAQIRNQQVLIGSQRFLEARGVAVAPIGNAEEYSPASSLIHLACGGRHLASFLVGDPIRETTAEAVRLLRQDGFDIAMITGDSSPTACHIAEILGINRVVAEVLPDAKVAAVTGLQAFGKVAFIGDGINDAPALAAADVGIAIGTATDVAIESAEVVLINGDLRKVAAAFRLSRATLRNIRQNLFWAFAYNAALIPVAAGVLFPFFNLLLSPILAAMAMSLSSLCVLANALRLKKLPI